MRSRHLSFHSFVGIGLGVVSAIVVGVAFAGDLNPPAGPVAPTMKTLDEAEPRVPLDPSDVPIVISVSGSYYLTGNIQASVSGINAITVNADHVTLDLMGHTIGRSEAAQFSNGVVIASGVRGVKVFNGAISDCLLSGLSGASAHGCSAIDLHIDACAMNGVILGDEAQIRGCVASGNGLIGISCGASSVVEGCTSTGNHQGINASSGSVVRGCIGGGNASGGINVAGNGTIAHCTANGNGSYGITAGTGSIVSLCTAADNTLDGVNTGFGSLIERCASISNDQHGVSVGGQSRVIECSVSFNGAHGIVAASNCLISGNECSDNGAATADGAGVYTGGSKNRIQSNMCNNNDYGVFVGPLGGNLIVQNTTSASTVADFQIASGNSTGGIKTSPVGAGAWDNLAY